MKLDDNYDDFEYGGSHISGTAVFILVSLFVLLILAVALVISQNTKKNKTTNTVTNSSTTTETAESQKDIYGMPNTSDILGGSKLSPEDLDFWDMYSKEKTVTDEDATSSSTKKESDKSNKDSKNSKDSKDSKDIKDEDKDKEEDKDKDNKDDGKHTKVTLRDGSEEWVAISSYLTKNNYDVTKFVETNGILKYVDDGKTKSFFGTDISKYQGVVDFYALKDAGVDYVMLKVGGRGYSSGTITIDEYFVDNITKASDAGMGVGLYFYSQAITTDEAVEEANVVLNSIGERKVTYPIAFDMEFVENDTSRIEALSKADKTNIAKAFMDTIAAAGYRPILYGNKEWLIKEVDLTKLSGYEIWLSQISDLPDYPYKYSMWQYSTSGKINGINGSANMNICFLDYSNK